MKSALRLLLLAVISALAWLPVRAAEPAPADGGEAAFRKLMELDETVQQQIEQWQGAAQTNRWQQDEVSQATLNLKIKQQLERLTDAYVKFLKDHPTHVKGRLTFGSFLSENGRDTEALAQLEEARKLAPENAAVWNNLGNHYGQNGPATNAFACYAKAIELAPRQALYYHNLARNLYLYQDVAADYYRLKPREVLAKAQELYRKSLELDPNNFSAATDLAQSYYAIRLPLTGNQEADAQAAQKLADESLAAWQAALKLARDDASRQGVHLHLARIQISARRFADARTSLAQVKEPALAGLKVELEARLEKERARAKP